MRDKLCDKDDLKETIEFNKKFLIKDKEKIVSLQDDIKNGIQRYPRKNEDIIFDVKGGIFRLLNELIRAKYSLGMDCDSLEELYLSSIPIIAEIGSEDIGYVNFIQFFALGILLEAPIEKMNELVKKVDEEELDDVLLDFLINACSLKRKIKSKSFQKENPYKETIEFINLSFENKEMASLKLTEYMDKKWFKGHYDYEWRNAHKEPGYVGFWSFETAALAKILKLDDSRLKDNNHYPYDLAHYKNGKEFFAQPVEEIEEDFEEEYEVGIPVNEKLEQLIPSKFHKLINQLIIDYDTLNDEEFWSKYELNNIWFFLEEYIEYKKNNKILGSIIVNVLVVQDYILQLDYKDELEDYIGNMKNYWKKQNVKLIRLELDNDQYYYVYVPETFNLSTLYEVNIYDVNDVYDV